MSEIVLHEQVLRDVPGLVYFTTERFAGVPDSGVKALFRFENSYGASVVFGPGSYGVELAVLLYDEDAPVEGDALAVQAAWSEFSSALEGDPLMSDECIAGWLNEEKLKALLEKLRNLPSPYLKELDS